MSPQSSSAAQVADSDRFVMPASAPSLAVDAKRPVLTVVSLPPEPTEAAIDPAERDRQASLEMLHRLVMG